MSLSLPEKTDSDTSAPGANAAHALVRTIGVVPGLALAGLDRTRQEAANIWRDARALSQGDNVDAEPDGEAPLPTTPPSSDQVDLVWYAGLAVMGALRFIEWRLAAVIAAAHTVERYGHRQRVREFVEGLDAGF